MLYIFGSIWPLLYQFFNYQKPWVNNSIEILFERATKKREQRPLLKDITLDEFVSIYENRMNLYQECANITLNAENKSINEIVEEISNHEKFSF